MITPVASDEEYSTLRALLSDYHEWMHEHAGDVYDPDAELRHDVESLATEPESWAWIADDDGDPAGCVLLYGTAGDVAEFKRLWVDPAARGSGLGRALVERVAEKARTEGYETLGLTTPPWATAAHELYESLGFERTPPYPETRLPERFHDEALFMRLALSATEE